MGSHPNLAFSRIEADDLIFGRANGLSMAERGLLWILVRHVNRKTGECYPSDETIALCSGLSDRHVRRARERLRALRILDWTPTRNGARQGSNRYTINVSPLRPERAQADTASASEDAPSRTQRPSQDGLQADIGESSDGHFVLSQADTMSGDLPEREPPEINPLKETRASAPAAGAGSRELGESVSPTLSPLTRKVVDAIAQADRLAPIVRDPERVALDLVKLARPCVDIVAEIVAANGWVRDNPSKAPKAKGGLFLIRWIRRATPADARPTRPNDTKQYHPDAPTTFRRSKQHLQSTGGIDWETRTANAMRGQP